MTRIKPAAQIAAEKWLPEAAERLRKWKAGEPFNDGFPEDGEILGRHGGMTPLERALFLINVYAREERYQKQQRLKQARAVARAEDKARKRKEIANE